MTIDDLVGIQDAADRAAAAADYIQRGKAALTTARQIRDDAIIALLTSGNKPTAVARACKVSLSQVKLVKKLRGLA